MNILFCQGMHDPLFAHARQLRQAVFCAEQGYPLSEEVDEYDKQAFHVVGYIGGLPVAVARLIILPNQCGKIGRVAVSKRVRGQGLARQLFDFILPFSEQQELTQVVLSAQLAVYPMYVKFGFQIEGDRYYEMGVAHIHMRRLFAC